jgi:uncharacterized membrane protein
MHISVLKENFNGSMKQKADFCQICRKRKKPEELVPLEIVREPIARLIWAEHKKMKPDGFICLDDLNHYRGHYVKNALQTDKGELSTMEKQVLKSLKEHELMSKNINEEFDRNLTVGQKTADKVAAFVGSWKFIAFSSTAIAIWIAINLYILVVRPFDPYPFILLNLVLSCVAALQAPVILMSQNRQIQKETLRAEHDYSINLKAELEIRHLHEKIDHLLMNQWQRLLEIQEVQTELMEELTSKNRK